MRLNAIYDSISLDAARQFLSAANPSDKYQFFLKGTQLRQLSEEYEVIKENIEKTDKILQQKKEVIPDLDRAFRDASNRYKEAEKARAQADKAEELKKELAWAHVAAKERVSFQAQWPQVIPLTSSTGTGRKNDSRP